MNEWSEVELRELVEMSTDKIETKSIPEKCYVSTDSMLPDFGGVSFNGAIPSVAKTSSFSIDDVLFSNIRTYFRKLWIADRNGGCSNDVIVFRPKKHVHPRFLFYSLMDERFIRHTVQTSKGTKMPRGDKSAIIQYKTKLPPLPEQKAIADILGSLDDKIELNRRMNETLEGLAQALFKSWFVDFDPVLDNAILAGNSIPDEFAQRAEVRRKVLAQNQPSPNLSLGERDFPDLGKDAADFPTIGNKSSNVRKLFPDSFQPSELGPIPTGWEVSTFGDVSTCFDRKRIPLSKKQRKEKKPGHIPYYGATSIMDYINEWIFDDTYLLIGEDGSVMKEDGSPFVQYIWGKSWVNNHAHVLQGATGISTEHLMLFMLSQNMTAYVTGAVQLKINQKNMNGIPFLKASDKVNATFSDCISPSYERIKQLKEEEETLTTLRDTLLPKLISGELRIEDAEKMVGVLGHE